MILNRRFLLVLFMCYPALVFGADSGRPVMGKITPNILKATTIQAAIDALNKEVTNLQSDPYYKNLSSDAKQEQKSSVIDPAIEAAKKGGKNDNTNNSKKKSDSEQNKDTRTDEEKADALSEKQDAYDEAKAKEQSTANKMLGGLTTAATGLGAMELMQGLSEQKADDEAAEDMAAYLATFRCTYAGGKSVKGGTEPIELPGGNDKTLMQLRNEYVTLAASLKERKESLGMKPGIESEEILDKAEMGLYDDENVGITKGHYASLYRAQTGNAEDQAKIDAEKSKSEKRVKGGAIAAGIGVVGGIAGNALINGGSGKGGGLMDKVKDLVGDDESGDLLGKLKDSFGDDSEGLLDKVKGIVGDDKMSDVMKNLDVSKLKDLSGGDLDNIDIESLKGSLGDKASILDGLGQ